MHGRTNIVYTLQMKQNPSFMPRLVLPVCAKIHCFKPFFALEITAASAYILPLKCPCSNQGSRCLPSGKSKIESGNIGCKEVPDNAPARKSCAIQRSTNSHWLHIPWSPLGAFSSGGEFTVILKFKVDSKADSTDMSRFQFLVLT